MSEVIHLHTDPHQQAQMLMPWYVNGTLEGEELVAVETHLAACPQCREELAGEQALAGSISSLPAETEPAWAALKALAEAGARRQAAQASGVRHAARPARRSILTRRVAVGWMVAAQAAMVVLGVGVVFVAAPRLQPQSPAPSAASAPSVYHVLGATPAAVDGNVLVMFRPTTSEQELRQSLLQNGARMVDGPTATGGYVLHVPADRRDAVLARLRGRRDVVLAEAVDGDLRP